MAMNFFIKIIKKRIYLGTTIFIASGLLLLSCVFESDLNDISNRVDLEDEKVTEILEMIQSVTVIPTCSDGSVGIGRGVSRIKFEILPLEAAQKLPNIPPSSFSLKYVPTFLTRSEGVGNNLSIESINYENEEVIIEASGANLPDDFFYGLEGVSCRLKITNGLNNVSSSFFSLIPDNTSAGFFFRLRDLSGNYYEPFLVENSMMHVSVPDSIDLSSLYPVIIGKSQFESCSGIEFSGEKEFNFSDFTNPFTFRKVLRSSIDSVWTVKIYDLPVLMIDTPNKQPIVSKDERVEGTDMRIVENGMIATLGTAGVRGRGNSTWELEKKPYNIKLDKKYPILGMESSKSWILLANAYYDRTQLHNATAFEMARLTDYPWVQSGAFVELFLNGEHRGLYYLCEKIREGKNAVNIGNGFLLESSVSGGKYQGFVYSDYYNDVGDGRWDLGWEIKAPDEITTERYDEIKNALNKMESLIKSEEIDHTGLYRNYYDIETAIDWLLVEETALNEEASRSKNIYMYMDDSGMFKMGPPWDFDAWTFGLYGTGHFYCTNRTLYYKSILKDNYFVNRLQEKWAKYKPIWLDKIPKFIDSQYTIIRRAAERNDMMWPDWCPENKASERTYKQSVEAMKEAFVEQINWMDTKIQNGDFTN